MKAGFIVLMALVASGCSTAYDLGGGRYAVTRVSEVRSPFGTNMGFAKLEACDGIPQAEEGLQPLVQTIDYRNCTGITDWMPMSSQGQGGQIVSGALIGVGIGVAGAVAEGASATATGGAAVSKSIAASGRGGHH